MRHIFFSIFFFCFQAILHAKVYYVNPSGMDTNTGDVANPWKTIQYAANTAVAGDSVYVQNGLYTEQVTFANSGTAESLITFLADDHVTVEGPSSMTGWTGIFILYNKSYLRIKGFRLQNSYWFGIYAEAGSNLYLEGNHTYNTGASGISVWHSNHVYAFGNKVQKACYQSISMGSQECITFSGVSDFEIHDNEVFESGGSDNGGEGIDTKENCVNGKVYSNRVHDLIRLGIYADCWDKTLQNVEIYNNIVYNCHEGFAVSSENGGVLQDVKIYNNIAYHNNNFGITVSDYGIDGLKKNVSIFNNTVYKNGFGDNDANWGGGIIVYSNNVQNILIYNNIVSDNDAMQISNRATSSVTVTKNLVYGYRGLNWTSEIKGSDVLEADPLLADPDGEDNIMGTPDDNLNVTPMSPSINAGTNTNAPPFDYNYHARPAEEITDLGAYEANSIFLPVYPETVTNPVLLKIYPNPSNDFFLIRMLENLDTIELVAESGSIIRTYKTIRKGETITIQDPLKAGIYYLKASSLKQKQVYKLIKQ